MFGSLGLRIPVKSIVGMFRKLKEGEIFKGLMEYCLCSDQHLSLFLDQNVNFYTIGTSKY